jgi:hypothetical protein
MMQLRYQCFELPQQRTSTATCKPPTCHSDCSTSVLKGQAGANHRS